VSILVANFDKYHEPLLGMEKPVSFDRENSFA
jgi:hypothetical protein